MLPDRHVYMEVLPCQELQEFGGRIPETDINPHFTAPPLPSYSIQYLETD